MTRSLRIAPGTAAVGRILWFAAAAPAGDRIEDVIGRGTRWLVSRQDPGGGYRTRGTARALVALRECRDALAREPASPEKTADGSP